MAIYKLTGCVQNYAWGGKDYIPALFSLNKQPEQSYAEWWLGAHSSAPSIIHLADKQMPLNEFIAQNPQVLGKQSAVDFGPELPFLLKILDVAKPLSIQLHPTKQQAQVGFEAENKQGVDLKAATRTYKDRNHKPEMMIALSEFWLLHGFKAKQQIIATLKTRPSLTALATQLENQDLHRFYASIMQADQTQLASWLLPIIQQNKTDYLAHKLTPDNPDYWVLYTMDEMEISEDKLDAGLICFYLFNIVKLEKGEGIYQAAGIPHAYLRGQNIELMACSDNVIRGGLTPKHIDIPALLEIVDCREVEPEIIPVAPNQRLFTYSTPATDFALSQVKYEVGQMQECHAQSAQIVLVMQGELKLLQKQTALVLKQGESALIDCDTAYQIEGLAQGYAVIAKLPE